MQAEKLPTPDGTPENSGTAAFPPGLLLILAGALALRVGIALATRFTNEDSLITLRYAENLASGNGFVYNLGERVLGTTTPLYALLLALAAKLGLPPLVLGKALNILADGGICLVLFWWLRDLGRERAGWVAAFLAAVNPLHVRWCVAGMETSLVALCGILAWWLWWRRRYLWTYVVLGVLFLLRWDSVLLTGVLTVALVIRERRLPLRELALYVGLAAPWLVFAAWYFGSPIPVTAGAKLIVYGWHGQNDLFPGSRGLPGRLASDPVQGLMALVALAGVVRAWKVRELLLAPPAVWLLAYGVLLSVTPVLLFEWYLVPPLPVFELFAALGLGWIMERVRPVPARRLVAGSAAVVTAVAGGWRAWDLCARNQRLEERLRQPLGQWLAAQSRPGDRVMLEPIGYIGYYSRLRVLDVIGLVSPQVLPYWKRGSESPLAELALDFRPEWCVLRPREVQHIRTADPEKGRRFAAAYRLARTFEYAPPGHEPYVFQVFRRAEKEQGE